LAQGVVGWNAIHQRVQRAAKAHRHPAQPAQHIDDLAAHFMTQSTVQRGVRARYRKAALRKGCHPFQF